MDVVSPPNDCDVPWGDILFLTLILYAPQGGNMFPDVIVHVPHIVWQRLTTSMFFFFLPLHLSLIQPKAQGVITKEYTFSFVAFTRVNQTI